MADKTHDFNEMISKIFFSYIKKTLYRTARDYLRAEGYRQEHSVFIEDIPEKELEMIWSVSHPSDVTAVAKTKSNFHIHLQNELLADVIPELDENERDVIFLLYYEEMTTTEAAEILGVSQQAISKKRNKLLGRFRNGI